jgi:hypothetical protein
VNGDVPCQKYGKATVKGTGYTCGSRRLILGTVTDALPTVIETVDVVGVVVGTGRR